MTLRQTHTYAELEVSYEAWQEIAGKLHEAGYGQVFVAAGTMDMHGIALVLEASSTPRMTLGEFFAHATEDHDGVELIRCLDEGGGWKAIIITRRPGVGRLGVYGDSLETCLAAACDCIMRRPSARSRLNPPVGNIKEPYRLQYDYRERDWTL
jgi:hypothetical protein